MKALTPADWSKLRDWKKNAKDILDDLNKAKEAEVPNVELLIDRCEGCIDRINKLEATKKKVK